MRLARASADLTAIGADPLGHTEQATARAAGRGVLPGNARAIVIDFRPQFPGREREPDAGVRAGSGVLEGVGECFLNQPVHRELHPFWQVGHLSADLQHGAKPRRPDLLDQLVQFRQPGSRLPGIAGRLAGILPEHAEQPTGVG